MKYNSKVKFKIFTFVKYFILVIITVIFLMPFIWMLSTSLKSDADIFSFPPKFFTLPLNFSNYVKAWQEQDFNLYTFNTIKITFLSIIFAVFSSTLVAYGFARMKFPGKKLLFIILLSTMMIPYEVQIIPLYIEFKYLGWINTHLPLIVPCLFANAFFVFLVRQFIMGIPYELDESAIIDGCNSLQIFYKIILPLAVPAMTTCIIFQFMWCWNDFVGPLIYLQTRTKWTFTLGLAAFRNQTYNYVKWNQLMALATIYSFVPLLVYYFSQDKLIGGIATTGIKS